MNIFGLFGLVGFCGNVGCSSTWSRSECWPLSRFSPRRAAASLCVAVFNSALMLARFVSSASNPGSLVGVDPAAASVSVDSLFDGELSRAAIFCLRARISGCELARLAPLITSSALSAAKLRPSSNLDGSKATPPGRRHHWSRARTGRAAASPYSGDLGHCGCRGRAGGRW